MPAYLLRESGCAEQRSALGEKLRAAVPDLVEATSLDAILNASAGDERKIVLMLVPQSDPDYVDRFIQFAGRHRNDLSLILVGGEISANDYKRLMRGGVADWVSADTDPGEIKEIIGRLQAKNNSDPHALSSGRRPITISFVPSAGGVGNTTIVTEVAGLINANKTPRQRRICIVDLDFQTSHICDYLDSEPRLQIGELSSAPERLDEHLFESYRTRHGSGIDIFAAPRSKFASDILDISALDTLFSMIAGHYDLILVDYPVPWFSWTGQIIAASDGAVISGLNTIPCLRQVSETLAQVRSNGSTALEIAIAINRCERTMLGAVARRKHVEIALPDERLFFLGCRPETVESVNMGMPMSLGASARKIRKDFAGLADFCGGLKSTRI